VPTSSYDAYHFVSQLYLDEDAVDTLMIVDEYYAPNVGLVKLISRSGNSRRLIILIDDL
jgi:hypothetical protein